MATVIIKPAHETWNAKIHWKIDNVYGLDDSKLWSTLIGICYYTQEEAKSHLEFLANFNKIELKVVFK